MKLSLVSLVYLICFIGIPTNIKGQSDHSYPTYPIVIDPGHGSATVGYKDERWDPITNSYLSFTNYGSQYKNYHEHEIVLELSKKLKYYLDLTNTNWGWKRFRSYLSQFSKNKNNFSRVHFTSSLTRNESWKERGLPKANPRLNDPYRMYDYPTNPQNPTKKTRLHLGRLSRINHKKPYLVVSLHMTLAGRKHKGGMAAVLSPGYKTLNLIRQISLGKKPRKDFRTLAWEPYWLVTRKGWSRFQSAYSDTWVYFHGHNTRKDSLRIGPKKFYRGIRHNLLQWRYADPPGWELLARKGLPAYTDKHALFHPQGLFWERERNIAEEWRREEKGLKGFGGDNHYASDELLRYIQFGMRMIAQKKSENIIPGPIQPPYVSTYSLPIYTNAIVAYLEVGYLNHHRDRKLLIKNRDQVALCLAVGIYSLFMGLNPLKPGYTSIRPRGQNINWQRYENRPEGNYFTKVL